MLRLKNTYIAISFFFFFINLQANYIMKKNSSYSPLKVQKLFKSLDRLLVSRPKFFEILPEKCNSHLLATRKCIFTIILPLFSTWSLLPISTTRIIADFNLFKLRICCHRCVHTLLVTCSLHARFSIFCHVSSPFIFLFVNLCATIMQPCRNINNNYEKNSVLHRHWTAMSAVVKATTPCPGIRLTLPYVNYPADVVPHSQRSSVCYESRAWLENHARFTLGSNNYLPTRSKKKLDTYSRKINIRN